jgi:hypothetical protein
MEPPDVEIGAGSPTFQSDISTFLVFRADISAALKSVRLSSTLRLHCFETGSDDLGQSIRGRWFDVTCDHLVFYRCGRYAQDASEISQICARGTHVAESAESALEDDRPLSSDQ